MTFDVFSGPFMESAIKFLLKQPFAPMKFEKNGWFSYNDSAAYYSMVKLRDPRTLIEVGSGHSTKIASQASKGMVFCVDPAPRADVEEYCDQILRVKVQTLKPETVADCDLLFIDSSHTWAAGDLPFLFNQVFPLLRLGTFVHLHDIFLPDDYPLGWEGRHYDEQYHLQEFLEGHSEYKTLWPAYYMATRRTEETKTIFGNAASMGSFWMVKC